MTYKIDFHMHTNKSFDGISSLDRLISKAKQKGLNGIAITDHNLCTHLQDYAMEDFLVIPGCEISTELGHITALFIGKDILVSQRWQGRLPSAKEAVEAIHACGGIAVLAHPYAKKNKTYDKETMALFDGVEVHNARASFKNVEANEMAHDLAKKYGKVKIAGSDGHSKYEVGNAYTLVDAPSLTLEAIKRSVLQGSTDTVLVKNTPHFRKGNSQFIKALRTKRITKIIKAIVYIAYCIMLDLTRRH